MAGPPPPPPPELRRERVKVERAKMIPLAQLLPADWNANRVRGPMLAKIRRSIEDNGLVENLVARPHPFEDGFYEVLSGNHRLGILLELGVDKVPVVVVDVDDPHARILAQTLNRTRGRDDPLAYRALIGELAEILDVEDIAAILPENVGSISELLGGVAGGERDVVLPTEVWGVIIICNDKGDQDDLLDRLAGEGRDCRPIMRGGD